MIERKTITITRRLDGRGEFEVAFPQVSFVPNEVIVRGISVMALDQEKEPEPEPKYYALELYSTLINDVLFSQLFGNIWTSNEVYEIHHSLTQEVRGSYTFKAFNVYSGERVLITDNVTISFQLEFVKYS